MPRGCRSNRRTSSVMKHQIQAIQAIKNSQRHIFSQETEEPKRERPTEIWPMKNLAADPYSSNNYSGIVDSNQLWSEDVRNYWDPKV